MDWGRVHPQGKDSAQTAQEEDRDMVHPCGFWYKGECAHHAKGGDPLSSPRCLQIVAEPAKCSDVSQKSQRPLQQACQKKKKSSLGSTLTKGAPG